MHFAKYQPVVPLNQTLGRILEQGLPLHSLLSVPFPHYWLCKNYYPSAGFPDLTLAHSGSHKLGYDLVDSSTYLWIQAYIFVIIARAQ